MGNAFGGGMGRTGETCGAVTGALIIISLKYGAGEAGHRALKENTYELAGKFIKEYKVRNTCVACRDLLGFEIGPGTSMHDEKKDIISQKCPDYVKDAAEILEDILRSNHAKI